MHLIENWLHASFFISNTRLKLAKNQAKAKQQKQPTRGVLKKKCSENMQQIYM